MSHVTSQRRAMKILWVKLLETPFCGVLTDGVREFEAPYCGVRHHLLERRHHFLSFSLSESARPFDCVKVVKGC